MGARIDLVQIAGLDRVQGAGHDRAQGSGHDRVQAVGHDRVQEANYVVQNQVRAARISAVKNPLPPPPRRPLNRVLVTLACVISVMKIMKKEIEKKSK